MKADSALDRLVSLVPPPATPVDGDGDWQHVETRLGLGIPADYKELLRRYGVGQFDEVTLLAPFGTYPGGVLDLADRAELLIAYHEDVRPDVPERFPFPLYPEEGGLLPWATTDTGTDLCWPTEGRPDDWPTAIWNSREGGHRYERGAVELLHGYLSGQLRVDLLGPPPDVPWFDPYRERWTVSLTLADGEAPPADRVRILREHLAPTADRGSYHDIYLDRWTYGLKAVERDWLLTYVTGYGADWIEVRFPPEDNGEARIIMSTAVHAMGYQLVEARRNGKSVWSDDVS